MFPQFRSLLVWTLALLALIAASAVLQLPNELDAVAVDADRAISVASETILFTQDMLLLARPPDGLIDELFDFYLVLSERAATGEVPAAWAAYLYVNYWRDAVRDRPDGIPRRGPDEIHEILEQQIEFFSIRRRPGAAPSPFGAWVWQAAPMR